MNASPNTDPSTPRALPRFASGYVSATTAAEMGKSPAAPNPCRARPPSMIANVGAVATVTEPMPNNTASIASTYRRPKVSAMRVTVGTPIRLHRTNTFSTQGTIRSPTSKWSLIAGIAGPTMAMSRAAISEVRNSTVSMRTPEDTIGEVRSC